jgi:hypothetical protein
VALAQIELRRQHDDARPRIDRQPRVLFVRHARVGSPVAAEWTNTVSRLSHERVGSPILNRYGNLTYAALPRARGFTGPDAARRHPGQGSPAPAWVHSREEVGQEDCGEARSRQGAIERPQPLCLRQTTFLSIRGQTSFGFCGPYIRHTKEMPLQGGVTSVAHQLHAV